MSLNLHFTFDDAAAELFVAMSTVLSRLGESGVVLGVTSRPHVTIAVIDEHFRCPSDLDSIAVPRLNFEVGMPFVSKRNGKYVLAPIVAGEDARATFPTREWIESTFKTRVVSLEKVGDLHVTIGFFSALPVDLQSQLDEFRPQKVLVDAIEISERTRLGGVGDVLWRSGRSA